MKRTLKVFSNRNDLIRWLSHPGAAIGIVYRVHASVKTPAGDEIRCTVIRNMGDLLMLAGQEFDEVDFTAAPQLQAEMCSRVRASCERRPGGM